MRGPLTDIDYDRVEHETEKAYLFVIGTKKVWLPKSLVEINHDGTITLPEDIAIEKELV